MYFRRSSSTASKTNKRAASDLLSRLPRATELTIRPIRRCSSELPPLEPIATAAAANGRSCRKRGRTAVDERDEEASRESKLERKIGEFLEYTKKRDEENRNILLRMLEVVEDIRNSVRWIYNYDNKLVEIFNELCWCCCYCTQYWITRKYYYMYTFIFFIYILVKSARNNKRTLRI